MIRPPVNWSEVPSERPPMLAIHHAPKSGEGAWTILSDRGFGVFTHWDQELRRTVPCTDPYGCICQSRQVTNSWRSYLAVQEIRGGKVRLLEVTADAWRMCQAEKWIEHRGSIRGCRITLKRQRPDKHAAIIAQLHDPVGDIADALPPAPNVKDELQRIWYSRL